MLKNGFLVFFAVIFGFGGEIFGENNGFWVCFCRVLENFVNMVVFCVLLVENWNNYNV
jgi:hypothetical protein